MGRKKMNLILADSKLRPIMLKRKRLSLVKKVKELTILCGLKACLVIFSPNEAEPTVWPSLEVARSLINDFFALPEIQQKTKELTLESYWRNQIKNIEEKLRKTRKRNMEHDINLLMSQVHNGRGVDYLNMDELYRLMSFTKEKMMGLKRRLGIMERHCPPLGDPPVSPVDVQSKEVRTTTNDVFVGGGGREDERALRKTYGAAGRFSIGDAIKDTQTYYLFDKWVPFFEPLGLSPQIQQQIRMEMASNNTNPCTISFLPYKGGYFPYVGSSSNGNLTLEMEPALPPTRGLVGPVSQPLQNQHGMSNDPITDVSQPREDPFDPLNLELGVRGEGSRNKTTNDGLRQDPPLPPPPNETSAEEEGNVATTTYPQELPKNWFELR